MRSVTPRRRLPPPSRPWRRWVLLPACLFAAAAVGAATPPDQASERAARLERFQEMKMVPQRGGFLFGPGEFPGLDWEDPALARENFGDFSLRVRWFDAAGSEVERAEGEGRYGALIEGTTPDGMTIRRGKTFYCAEPVRIMSLLHQPLLELPPGPVLGMSGPAWEALQEQYLALGRRAVLQALLQTEEGAILAAGAAEWSEERGPGHPLNLPSVRHQEHHLRQKRKVLGVEEAWPPLNRPRTIDTESPVLAEGTAERAGFAPDLPDQLARICREWEREIGEPFSIVVARRGVIVFHEAFGQRGGAPVTTDTVYPLFSLTKGVAGIGLLLFLDQGLLELDAPLGQVLPDLPVEGPRAITLRQCLMHASGLSGHGRWRGPENPWLDNVVANGLETLEPSYSYSGLAYDLAGAAMALVSGKSVPLLFHEHLFEPLQMKGARIDELGAGGHLRAIDLARLGQLLLNGGSYGPRQFFGADTMADFLPQSYREHFPGLDASGREDYGLGIRWAPERHPGAGHGGRPADATIMSPRTIGHGSLSGSVFRVDLEQEIVVAVGRFHPGDRHRDFLAKLLLAVMTALPEGNAEPSL